jgi:AcrR family transcriptional regulator
MQRASDGSIGGRGEPLAIGGISHNLNGQKLGRKGRVTRERIMGATVELLNESPDAPISLSAVARRANLGMSSLYLYFSDLTELLMAVLEPVMAEAETAYLGQLQEHWPDDRLAECCLEFVAAYHAFWERNARILHLRNSMADNHDERMMVCRIAAGRPMIAMVAAQMSNGADVPDPAVSTLASVIVTGLERAVTISTDLSMPHLLAREFGPRQNNVVPPSARLLALAIRDGRINPTGE